MLHVSIENDDHQMFLYKILKVKCFYLRELANITTYC